MIVVISDLHFEEEASDKIPGRDGHPDLVFRRNLDPRAYRSFIAQMAEEVERRKASDFDLVIAGDLFDFSRTVLWFKDELRPYVSLEEVSPELEAKILNILDAIAAEPRVKEALETFRLLAKGKYTVWPEERNKKKERDFPAKRVRLHYLSGNHDRLSNASPKVRERVRALLGLKGDGSFPHIFQADDPAVLIRHGHEYDRNNFALDPEKFETIPLEVAEEGYSQANFGDFITIDIATRLPYLFRQKYSDQKILEDKVLSSLYMRLLQFDDVRPQSALLDYLLDTSDGNYSAEEAWEKLVPVLEQLLDQVHDDPFFRHWLAKRAKPWASAELESARGLLKLGGWRNRVARESARKLTHFFMGGETAGPEIFAQREQVVQEGKVRLVLAGHTHSPQVSLVASDPRADRFYINTGTWRDSIPSTPDRRTFGRLKTLTYVMLFSSAEERDNIKYGSFDYWSGYTKDWSTENPEDNEK